MLTSSTPCTDARYASIALTQGLHRGMQQRPWQIACRFGERHKTYAVLTDRVARLASALRELGVRAGDRVAMLSLNSDRYLEYYFSSWWAGAVVNPVNVRWSVAEIAYSLNDSDTRVLLVDEHSLNMVSAIRAQSPGLRTVIWAGDGQAPEAMPGYEALIDAAVPMEDACAGGDALAGVFYTGGTTGVPKGVMLSHANLWSGMMARMAQVHPDPDSVQVYVAPLFHLASAGRLIAQTIIGGQCVVLAGFDPAAMLQCIETYRVNEVTLVPSMIQMLLDHPTFTPERAQSLRRINYGASPIAESLLDRAMALMPQVDFSQSYGQTEAAVYITINGPESHRGEGRTSGRVRSAGRACLAVQVRIVDDNDCEVPRGVVGEIVTRGPNVMLGYWNMPAETAQTLRNGWLHTGDSGYMDDDGFVFIVDRVKDMIVSGAENVYSAEVENAVARHPAVESCAVIGVPHEKWGESVHVFVVLRTGMHLEFNDLHAHCRELIAGYKCPRSMEIRTSLPLSAVGKVLKRELRKPYWEGRDRAVA